jgi:glucose/arabinose dehydrogenase
MPLFILQWRFLIAFGFCIALLYPSQAQESDFRLREAFPSLTFSNPIDIERPGDGTNKLYIVEQPGIIRVVENDSSATEARIFLDIRSRLIFNDELGLLGLAFHPNFKKNGYFYVNYTAPDSLRTVIARYRVSATDPTVADSNSETILLEFYQPYENHKAGKMAFGPDGYLYISTGDGGLGHDPNNFGQTLTTYLGKILRIDVNDTSNGRNYAIPPDNPFVGDTTGRHEEIYAWGFRNPWRFSFDFTTGRLWCADVGQKTAEEVDIVERGKNYGWHRMEGFHCFPEGIQNCDTTGLTMPIYEYSHDSGVAVIGGHVYRGKRIPRLVGKYIYGDFGSGLIWGLTYDGVTPTTNEELLKSGLLIVAFGVDANNELYLCSFNGKIYTFDLPPDTTHTADTLPEIPPSGDTSVTSATRLHNSPNPLGNSTTIYYSLAQTSHVQLIVYDLLGRVVATLVDKEQESGEQKVQFDATSFPAGTYGYSLVVGNQKAVNATMTVLK